MYDIAKTTTLFCQVYDCFLIFHGGNESTDMMGIISSFGQE
jgi:hypothetical protein